MCDKYKDVTFLSSWLVFLGCYHTQTWGTFCVVQVLLLPSILIYQKLAFLLAASSANVTIAGLLQMLHKLLSCYIYNCLITVGCCSQI